MVLASFLNRCFCGILLALSLSRISVHSFTPPQKTMRLFYHRTSAVTAILLEKKTLMHFDSHRRETTSVSLYGTESDEDDVDNFDAEGFGGYLAPYALAVVASVLVTAAFFKFVLLDY